MKKQDYTNHIRIAPLYHFVLAPLNLLLLVLSIIHLYRTIKYGSSMLMPAVMYVLFSISLLLGGALARTFALKAQDRAVRAEENFRHYALTGRRLDPRLSLGQIAALRFASDEEFPGLALQAAEERISPDKIKRMVRQWRPDYHRV